MDKQRIYDAMLIKAFRADITLNQMRWWLKVYGISLPQDNLKRQPRWTKMRVQSFVGAFLKPLADRLWDTDRTQDIKTLDWMQKLNCEDTARYMATQQNKLMRDARKDRRRGSFLQANFEAQNPNNQWKVTK
jgi:hypothetical protein